MLPQDVMARVQDGTVVMLVGMGVVFAFLIIMVFAMDLMGHFMKFLNKFFPEEVVETVSKTKKVNKDSNEEIAVAIAASLNK